MTWVRQSGLAIVVARRAAQQLGNLQAEGCSPAQTARMLLVAWRRALCCGRMAEVAVEAAALAEWAGGNGCDPRAAVEDRAVDLTLRAGVVVSDLRLLAHMRVFGAVALRATRDECVALAGALGADADRSRCGLVWLELEDAAARGAGEALLAALLAQQEA
jgi:hypothetical protein